jgi:hypothetical protein
MVILPGPALAAAARSTQRETMDIHPLETWYQGHRFRSRTEARWAVFLDTLGIPYRYECDGYDLGGTWYLPDFWLPDQYLWLEIKGKTPIEPEQRLAWLLALESYRLAVVFGGNVWHTTPGYLFVPRDTFHAITPCFWALCRRCNSLGLHWAIEPSLGAYSNLGFCVCHREAGMSSVGHTEEDAQTRRLRAAFRAARQARFERYPR